MHVMLDNAYLLNLNQGSLKQGCYSLPPLKESRPEIPKVRKEGRGYISFNGLLDPMTIFFLNEADP